jgi:CPA2 family monovalent cation:H+ antiporter-2
MAAALPSLAQIEQSGAGALIGVLKSLLWAGLFLAVTLFLAARGVPWLLDRVARMRSRELFLITVVVICLGAAAGAEMAGLGLPLGAFMAGLIISESEYAHEVFAQIRPLRDMFAALFFVSVGMLLNPQFLFSHWLMVIIVVGATVIGKAVITLIPVFALTRQVRVSLFSGLGLAQIGEFSFVLATLGSSRGLIPPEISAVLVTVALVTILLTPALFESVEPLYRWLNRAAWSSRLINLEPAAEQKMYHRGVPARVLVLGYGRVGRYVSDALKAKDVPHLVVEYDAKSVERCRRKGIPVMFGDASSLTVLERARPQDAELAVVALPEAGMTEVAIRNLKSLSPGIQVVARVHRGPFIPRIRAAGADAVIHAEFEASTEMIRQGLDRLGIPDPEVDDYLERVRNARYRLWDT